MARKQRARRKKEQKTKQILMIAGIVLVIVLLGSIGLMNAPTQSAAEINVAQAYEMRADGAFILDVREPEEWNQHHIPGATLIPLGELASRVDELPSDQEIVVVCRSGNRSQTGRDILLNAGFESVTSMAGGVNDWIASGYEVVSGP
ncbi:MAG: rhodanese-like domain-containing protein [Anaerolineae bacterium]|nr:rhodanese-like domain-containing protein [Anaerolineae bacterium]